MERAEALDDLSAQLARRDSALDRREALLSARESEARSVAARARQHERDLDAMRTGLYSEQATLTQRRRELDARAAVVRDLSATAKKTAAQVTEKREELRALNENLATMYAALRNAQQSLVDVNTRAGKTAERENKCAQIVVALDARQRELDALQRELQRLQEEVARREEAVVVANDVLPLKDVLPGLRAIAREYRDFRQRRANGDDNAPSIPQPPQGTPEEARYLSDFFRDIRAFARSLEAREASVARLEQSLPEREKAVIARENALKDGESSLGSRRVEIEAQAVEVRSMLEKTEESARRIASAEQRLDSREKKAREMDKRLADRETHINRQRKLLAAQEKSLKRAGEAVRSHEEGVAGDAKRVAEGRKRIDALEQDIAAREALLRTKEIELGVREARTKRVEGSKKKTATVQIDDGVSEGDTTQASLDEDDVTESGLGRTIENEHRMETHLTVHTNPRPPAHSGANMAETVAEPLPTQPNQEVVPSDVNVPRHGAVVSETSVPIATMPPTVRKQLTFGQTPGPAVATNERNSETSSEVAASQLHGELKAARAVWIEKVNRLDTVVASMSEDLTSTGTQLLPVIRGVRAELKRIRDEASSVGTGLSTFDGERERHRAWARAMTAQLNTIKQVQAGLLHAFNRVLPQAAADSSQSTNPLRVEFEHELEVASTRHRPPLRLHQERGAVHSRSRRRRKQITASVPESDTSITSVSSAEKLATYKVQVPGWKEMDSAAIIRSPRTTAEELKALKRDLGLDSEP